MTFIEWVTAGLLVVAILEPIAALVWSKRYRESKEAEITALRAQIETLERLTPKHLWEQVDAMQHLARAYTEEIGGQLTQAQQKIDQLRAEGAQGKAQLKEARSAYDELSRNYMIIKSATDQHRLPSYADLISSVNSSTAVSLTTATPPPVTTEELREYLSVMGNSSRGVSAYRSTLEQFSLAEVLVRNNPSEKGGK